MSEDPKLRIVVNSDANMSRGKYAAQAVHAALTAAGMHPGLPVVVLGGHRPEVESKRIVIRDAGRTEVEPGTVTAGTDWNPQSSHRRMLADEAALSFVSEHLDQGTISDALTLLSVREGVEEEPLTLIDLIRSLIDEIRSLRRDGTFELAESITVDVSNGETRWEETSSWYCCLCGKEIGADLSRRDGDPGFCRRCGSGDIAREAWDDDERERTSRTEGR